MSFSSIKYSNTYFKIPYPGYGIPIPYPSQPQARRPSAPVSVPHLQSSASIFFLPQSAPHTVLPNHSFRRAADGICDSGCRRTRRSWWRG